MCPAIIGSRSRGWPAGIWLARSRISGRTLRPLAGTRNTMSTATGRSRSRPLTNWVSAGTPPAEAPATTMPAGARTRRASGVVLIAYPDRADGNGQVAPNTRMVGPKQGRLPPVGDRASTGDNLRHQIDVLLVAAPFGDIDQLGDALE